MKTKILLALIVSSFIIYPSAFGQGALTPPGAPAPTMKSLDQIEARTPVPAEPFLPFVITQPGSYYLTHNLNVNNGDTIHINTNGVTLDLNGFTISSTAANATGNGILIGSGLSDITIANGHIRGGVTNNGSGVYNGGGFNYGITYSGTAPVNVLVSHVSVSGCLGYGIYLNIGNSTVVEACTVRTVGGYGIVASGIKSCSALDCGANAIYGVAASDCRGQSSGGSYGIYVTTAQNCSGSSTGGYGLNAYTAQNCYGISYGNGDGIQAYTAQNCYGESDGNGDGLYASTAQNCYGESDGNGVGLYADSAQNCYGSSNGNGYGIYAYDTASGCFGSSATGTGLYAFIANVCHGVGSTALSTSHNVNSY